VICVLTFANKVANDIKKDEEYERRGKGEREVLKSTAAEQKFKKLVGEYCDKLHDEIQNIVGEIDVVKNVFHKLVSQSSRSRREVSL